MRGQEVVDRKRLRLIATARWSLTLRAARRTASPPFRARGAWPRGGRILGISSHGQITRMRTLAVGRHRPMRTDDRLVRALGSPGLGCFPSSGPSRAGDPRTSGRNGPQAGPRSGRGPAPTAPRSGRWPATARVRAPVGNPPRRSPRTRSTPGHEARTSPGDKRLNAGVRTPHRERHWDDAHEGEAGHRV